jgi:hypothetical protein
LYPSQNKNTSSQGNPAYRKISFKGYYLIPLFLEEEKAIGGYCFLLHDLP